MGANEEIFCSSESWLSFAVSRKLTWMSPPRRSQELQTSISSSKMSCQYWFHHKEVRLQNLLLLRWFLAVESKICPWHATNCAGFSSSPPFGWDPGTYNLRGYLHCTCHSPYHQKACWCDSKHCAGNCHESDSILDSGSCCLRAPWKSDILHAVCRVLHTCCPRKRNSSL